MLFSTAVNELLNSKRSERFVLYAVEDKVKLSKKLYDV